MADTQVMLAFRISEEISDRIIYLMEHMGLGEASRSQVARKALELGLEMLEQQIDDKAPLHKSVYEEIADLRRRVDALEASNRKNPFMRDA